MSTKQGALFRSVPMIIIMGTIFFLSHQPGDSMDLLSFPGLDKVAHISIYGLLAGSIIYAFNPLFRISNPKWVIFITLCICLLYGISDELHQSFIPNREKSLADVLADFTGGVFTCLVWYRTRKWRATSSYRT